MYDKDRPILSIPTSPTERVLNVLSSMILFVTYAYIIFMWGELPDKIPTHFNGAGEVDGWGSKWSVLPLPIIGTIIFMVFIPLRKYPHRYNYPVEVTLENAERLYSTSKMVLSVLTTIISVLFLLISYEIIQVALGYKGIGNWLLPVTLLSIFGTVFFFLFRTIKLK
ncbi:DUF1648 domain-containing protein [Bacillus suaedaesalsae]|uniref:DUF1648 domain-containing protein n=1 Tax=Bacillus suaedaesalsae TaxID=2810349 RepID=A0ABS2DMP6_9BACI|nr:DUF1648 domain-containing protein [Bacillus suaedaesalsae]MBM6619777.1 DUF1648 domain-containing protein [Bacillus suaedaesalsae]